MVEVPRLRKAAPPRKPMEQPAPKEESKGFGIQLKKSKQAEKPAAPAAPKEMPKLKKVPEAPKADKPVSGI